MARSAVMGYRRRPPARGRGNTSEWESFEAAEHEVACKEEEIRVEEAVVLMQHVRRDPHDPERITALHVRTARQQKRPEVALGDARLSTPAFVALTLVDRPLLEQRAQVGIWRDLGHLRHAVRDVEVARDLGSVIRRKVAPSEAMCDERLVVTDRCVECAPLVFIARLLEHRSETLRNRG